MKSWDYIIIGAGSSGCTLAYELARSGSKTVLILESGGKDNSPSIKIPAGVGHAVAHYDWGYMSQPDPSRYEKTDKWLRGHVVGGSSSINGMMYVRGSKDDFDRWAEMGNLGWSAKEVMPLFKEIEGSDQNADIRGKAGKLRVTTTKNPHKLTKAFLASSSQAGFAINDDYNGQNQEGVGYAQLSQKSGFRCSASKAFLKPVLGQANVTLKTGSFVTKINIEDGQAKGVYFRCKGKDEYYPANRVVVCAGAINSPKLLMLSGVGNADELRRHGINTVVDSPNVGLNLQEHPLVRLIYKTKIPSNNLTQGLFQKLKIGLRYLIYRDGPIANLFEAVAFLKTSIEKQSPDIQLHFISMGMGYATDSNELFLKFPSVTILLNKSHPVSRGHISLASNNPSDAPLIHAKLVDRKLDIDTLSAGISVVRRIMAAKPICDFVDSEFSPGNHVNTPETMEEYIKRNTEIAYHPIGTCRMGVDAAAVVAPDLSVNGVEDLWVADASIMPDLISGNTNAVCLMIGLKAGKILNALDTRG